MDINYNEIVLPMQVGTSVLMMSPFDITIQLTLKCISPRYILGITKSKVKIENPTYNKQTN